MARAIGSECENCGEIVRASGCFCSPNIPDDWLCVRCDAVLPAYVRGMGERTCNECHGREVAMSDPEEGGRDDGDGF